MDVLFSRRTKSPLNRLRHRQARYSVLSDRAFGELRDHADLVSSRRLGLESNRVQTLANQLRSVWATGGLVKLEELVEC
jgi:hypothetical protein